MSGLWLWTQQRFFFSFSFSESSPIHILYLYSSINHCVVIIFHLSYFRLAALWGSETSLVTAVSCSEHGACTWQALKKCLPIEWMRQKPMQNKERWTCVWKVFFAGLLYYLNPTILSAIFLFGDEEAKRLSLYTQLVVHTLADQEMSDGIPISGFSYDSALWKGWILRVP